ncbi:MAG: ribosome recycling factor [Myxococcales bacterium]|nr:ribosome recycling factor [Myxococcales bacterium]MCB9749869.1 ribosome recycling factor [Myxococcales bacterium]
MQDEALELAEDGMKDAIDRLRKNLAQVRTGRANPSILDAIRVDCYGSKMSLKQVSTVSVGDARLLVIKPWDRNMIPPIEKAINSAALGLNASNDGTVVRVPIPQLTEERRQDLVKQARKYGEEAKIACRSVRRESNDMLKQAEKDKEISEDSLKRALESVQELTNKYVAQADDILKKKEDEILEV